MGPPDETIQVFLSRFLGSSSATSPAATTFTARLPYLLCTDYKVQQKGHNDHEMMQLGYLHVAFVVQGSGSGMVLLVVAVVAGPSSQRVGFRSIRGFFSKVP